MCLICGTRLASCVAVTVLPSACSNGSVPWNRPPAVELFEGVMVAATMDANARQINCHGRRGAQSHAMSAVSAVNRDGSARERQWIEGAVAMGDHGHTKSDDNRRQCWRMRLAGLIDSMTSTLPSASWILDGAGVDAGVGGFKLAVFLQDTNGSTHDASGMALVNVQSRTCTVQVKTCRCSKMQHDAADERYNYGYGRIAHGSSPARHRAIHFCCKDGVRAARLYPGFPMAISPISLYETRFQLRTSSAHSLRIRCPRCIAPRLATPLGRLPNHSSSAALRPCLIG
jgi:hypothetical protein